MNALQPKTISETVQRVNNLNSDIRQFQQPEDPHMND